MPPKKKIKTSLDSSPQRRSKRETDQGGAGDKGSPKGSFSAKAGDGDKASCAEKPKSRGVGLYAPDVKDDPISVFECKELISEKFEKMSVLLEKYQLHLGEKVYFATASEVSSRGLYQPVDPAKHFCYTLHQESQIKERDMKKLGTKASAAMEMFDELPAFLQYNNQKWAYDYQGEKQLNKEMRKKYKGDLNQLRSVFLSGAIGYAFKRGMTNGPGKAALEALINMAMIVSFDEDEYLESFRCFTMGGGVDKGNKLPVKINPPPSRASSRENLFQSPTSAWVKSSAKYLSQALGTVSDGAKAGPSSSPIESRSHTSETHSSLWQVKIDQRGVFADILACSGCEPNWPHIIFVGEVKCSGEEPRNFSVAAIDQLHREMLAVLLHQSLIYGILMSDTYGYLCRMSLDMDNRQITAYGTEYNFVDPKPVGKNPDVYFCLKKDSLKNMFFDMINAVEDIKDNVKEVCHFP